MLVFGLTSSGSVACTFWLLLHVFQAPVAEFRSAWFVVSVLTELAVLAPRTRRPAWRSRPSRLLWVTTAVVAAVATVLPFLPVARCGLVPLPGALLGAAIGVVLVYVAVTEGLKLALARRALKSRPSPI